MIFSKSKKIIDKFEDMKNIASNRLEDWLEEDEDINQKREFRQNTFYNNDEIRSPEIKIKMKMTPDLTNDKFF